MINKAQLVSGAATPETPAAVANGDNYLLAWRDAGGGIWFTQCPAKQGQDSYAWDKQVQVPNVATSGAPALANFKGEVYMAWKGESSDSRVFVASLKGSAFSEQAAVPNIGTSTTPAITATSTSLFLVFKGEHDDTLFWSKSPDGKSWSAGKAIPGAGSSDTPALTAHLDKVYLAFKGASDDKIFMSVYSDDWSSAVALPASAFATSHGPALGTGDSGNLHIVWKGASDSFVWEAEIPAGAAIDSTPRFDVFGKIVGIGTSARPALASQLSSATAIMLAFKGETSTNVYAAPLDDLARILPLPADAQPLTVTVSCPVTGFGSGPNRANFSTVLTLSSDGRVTFTGQYTDSGNLPLIASPPQNYSVVVALVGPSKKCYTFSHSKNDVPSASQDKWNIVETSSEIKNNWADIMGATAKCSCTNSMDIGSFLDEIVSDIEKLLGYVVTAVEIIG